MVDISDCSTPARSRLSWLSCLLGQYAQEHDWTKDEDPDSTGEMIREVTQLAHDLENILLKFEEIAAQLGE